MTVSHEMTLFVTLEKWTLTLCIELIRIYCSSPPWLPLAFTSLVLLLLQKSSLRAVIYVSDIIMHQRSTVRLRIEECWSPRGKMCFVLLNFWQKNACYLYQSNLPYLPSIYSLSEDFGRQGYLWHEKEKKKRDKLVLENIGAFNLWWLALWTMIA